VLGIILCEANARSQRRFSRILGVFLGVVFSCLAPSSAHSATIDYPPLKINQFGARCDGVSDDTAGFMTAVTRASGTGAGIQLPSGTCRISSANLTGLHSFSIVGNGSGNDDTASTLLLTGADSKACTAGANGGLVFGKNTWNIELRDLNLSYNNPGRDCLINISHASGDGFDPARIRIERVVFTGTVAGATTKAIFYDDAIEQLVEDSLFDDNKFQWNIFQPIVAQHYLINSTFSRNQFGANVTSRNFQVALGAGVVNLTLSSNNFEVGPNGVDCSGAAATGVNFIGNIFEDATSASGTWIRCALSGSIITGNQLFANQKGIELDSGSGNTISGGWIGNMSLAGIQDAGYANAIEGVHFAGSSNSSSIDILEQGTGARIGVNFYGSDSGVISNSIQLSSGSSGFLDYGVDSDSSARGIANLAELNAWQIRKIKSDGSTSSLALGTVAADYFPGVIYSAARAPVPPCDAQNNHRSVCTSDHASVCVNGTAYRPGGATACRIYCAGGLGWLASGSGC